MATQSELISKNNPLTPKKYSFLLDSYALKFAPDGWEDDEYTLQRDMKLFGVFRKFANSEMKFVKDGRDYLRDVYEAGGVNSTCLFTVTELLTTGVIRNRFVGHIDFSTYKITELSVDVQVIDGSFTDLILTRSKTEVNLLSSKTVDGLILPASPTQKITIPEINLNQIAQWSGVDDSDYLVAYAPIMQVTRSEFLETASVAGSQPMLLLDATQDYPGITFAFDLNLTLDQEAGVDAEYTIQLYLQRYNGGSYIEHVYESIAVLASGPFPYNQNITDSVTFDLNTGDSLKFYLVTTDLSGSGKITHTDITASLTALDATLPEKEIDSFLYHEAFEKIIELYTEFYGRFKSDFFGRTDIGYAADGVIGAIATGRFIRGAYTLNETFPIPLDRLFNSLQSIYCLGMGIELIDGVEKVVVEPMSHFFSNQIVLDVSDRLAPETIEKEYAPELAFNRIAAGYNSYDYLSLGGVYEYNTTSKFTTCIKPVDKELNIVSPYRADMSGIITIIRESAENKDVQGENEVFILDTIRDGENYIVRAVEGFEQSEDFGNRDILINLNISPKRNLLRWGSYLRGFLEKYLDSFVIWQTSDKNTKLSSTETGQSAVVENADILVSDLADPLWHPETFSIEVPIKESDIDYINANPYGIVKLTSSEYGYILSYKSKNENHKSEFKLLRVNTDYVTPSEVPVVPPITSLTINKTVSNNLSDTHVFYVKVTRFGEDPTTYELTQQTPVVIPQIGYGIYSIEEVDANGYEITSITPSYFVIGSDNENQVVEIINERTSGILTIRKAITDLPFDPTFFKVTITGRREVDPYEVDGWVSNLVELVFYDLPFDTYDIVEDSEEGFLHVSTVPDPITLDAENADGMALITNIQGFTPNTQEALYNWFALDGIAPEGWHVPSLAEFETLIYELGGEFESGGHLKETGTDYWLTENADNLSGFSARGAGFRSAIDGYQHLKIYSYFLVTDIFEENINYTIGLAHDTVYCSVGALVLNDGASIRLLKDSTELSDGESGTFTDYDGNTYPTICINGQEWMQTNLFVEHLADGTPIPMITDNTEWSELETLGMCYYDNLIP